MKYQKTTLSILISSFLLGAYAQAQEKLPEEKVESAEISKSRSTRAKSEVDVEKILVVGFRESLDAAERNKRDSDQFMDNISAEGLGNFADENVGDAAFSIPGIDIDFVSGSADGIIIGGLPSEFNQVQVNGVNISAVNNSGAFVGEGARSLGPYSTATLSGIEVFKSGRADQDEGSLGGTINLKGWDPLNFKKTRFNVGATLGYQELSEETDGKLSFLYGGKTRDERIGWVITGAIEYNKAREDRFTNGSQALPKRDLDRGDDFPNRETAAPTILTYRQIQNDFTRDNLTGTLHFQPTDRLILKADINYARFERDTLENATNFGGLNANAQANGTKVFVDDSVQLYDEFSDNSGDIQRIALAGIGFSSGSAGANSQLRNLQRTQYDRTLSTTLGAEWIINDSWDMSTKLSYTRNNFTFNQNDRAFQTFTDFRSVLWSLEGEEGLPEAYLINEDATVRSRDENTNRTAYRFNHDLYPAFDISDRSTWDQIIDDSPIDPANYDFRGTDNNRRYNEVERYSAQVDFVYYADSIEWLSDIAFGAKYFQSEDSFETVNYVSGLAQGGANTSWFRNDFTLADIGFQDSLGTFLDGHNFAGTPSNWVAADWDKVNEAIWGGGFGDFPGFGFDRIPSYSRLDAVRTSKLDTEALYALANFNTGRLIGNIGVRYVHDDFDAEAYELDGASPGRIFLDPTDDNNAGLDSAIDTNVLAEWNNLDNFLFVTGGRDEGYFLPSFNMRYALLEEENLFLRFSASRNLSRAPTTQTSATFNTNINEDTGTAVVAGQNPSLKPTFSSNYDLGIEWYPSSDLAITTAIRHKKLSNVRSTMTRFEENAAVIDPATGDLVNGLTVEFRIPEANGEGTVDSFELGYRQNFRFLPGFLSNTGMTFNYTYTDSQVFAPVDNEGEIRLNGSSPNSVNSQLFYQDKKFTARVSYSWRDPKRIRRETSGAFGVFDHYRRNVNFSSSYRVSKNMKLTFNVQNVTDQENRRTIAGTDFTSAYIFTGRRFLLGINYTM